MSNWGEELYYQSVIVKNQEKKEEAAPVVDNRVECTHCGKLFVEGEWDNGLCFDCQLEYFLQD